MTDQGQPAGWYHAEGDPPGTTRYWDGAQWQGGPQVAPTASGGAPPAVGGHQLASPLRRMAGRAIDFIINAIVAISIGAGGSIDFDSISNGDTLEVETPGFAIILVGAIFALLYEALFVAYMGGTPGKLILGMRVAEAESGTTPPSLVVSFKRAINKVVGILGTIGSVIWAVIGIASLVMLFTDERHQTVMDKVAGTVVIKT